jgi:hypothetical protein
MRAFEATRAPREGEASVSLKVRVVSGCFHREHSPHAYALIDNFLASHLSRPAEFTFVDHESGPELLIFVAAGIALAKSVIDLVTAIIKARSEGIKNGDRPSGSLEVVVRRVGGGDKYAEEVVIRVEHADPVNTEEIEARINSALKRLVEDQMAKKATRATKRARPRLRRG